MYIVNLNLIKLSLSLTSAENNLGIFLSARLPVCNDVMHSGHVFSSCVSEALSVFIATTIPASDTSYNVCLSVWLLLSVVSFIPLRFQALCMWAHTTQGKYRQGETTRHETSWDSTLTCRDFYVWL